MILTVTHQDILAGVINSRTADPIALAAQRAGLINPRVGVKTISWEERIEGVTLSDDETTFVPVTSVVRKWTALPDHVVRWLKRLTYESRDEALQTKRDKKGNVTHFELLVHLGEGQVQV